MTKVSFFYLGINTIDPSCSMSEAKHEASRKCTPSPTSYFYPYSLRRKIKMAIIKEQPNAYLQRSSKRQSNSKSKQTLGEMCRCSNTSSHVQDLFGLRKLYNLLWILNMNQTNQWWIRHNNDANSVHTP